MAHNKNKPYITPQTPTTTSRVLSECDINTSIYDNDQEMKKCGCGLGGAAASVGLLGIVVINELKKAALIAATQASIAKGIINGIEAGNFVGATKVIAEVKLQLCVSTLGNKALGLVFDVTNYTDVSKIIEAVYMKFKNTCMYTSGPFSDLSSRMCTIIPKLRPVEGTVVGNGFTTEEGIRTTSNKIVAQDTTATAEYSALKFNECKLYIFF
ncbi:hypothetical protein PFHG_03842 [Plasmodium falciparum HB3]|uniref:Rifin n=1 Tax=Plasmodium falciparum (isolate HB3) TaxID=137071 RepID=A0A0L7KGL9_PLAFX|nr:hypothetical protein PFHG_03842 [Plasmodium falciparum HB3]